MGNKGSRTIARKHHNNKNRITATRGRGASEHKPNAAMEQTEMDLAERISHRVFQTRSFFCCLLTIDKIQNSSSPEAVDSTREARTGMAAPTLYGPV